MKAVVNGVRGCLAGQDGQDLIEYGLLGALIAVIAIVAMTAVGTTINDLFYTTFPAAIARAL